MKVRAAKPKQNRPDGMDSKLAAISKAFHSLTPAELRWLIANPVSLQDLAGAARAGRASAVDPSVKQYLAKAKDADNRTMAVVKTTRAQRETARKLTLDLLRKKGIEKEVLALAEIRGERLDPFAGRDPAPRTGKEE